ncbi:SLC13 family permease [Marasmitruncus massiliensis]|uniref:SLC13 family permease n=1 Tax=Marasmitruncus massiliensis TaxID=1944642 RepID=UPI000C7E478A|nr:SLC13 family permease [Marasmitruncus massiliensis]
MSQIAITLLLLVFAIVMFVWEKIPLAVTSMIVCLGLVVTRVIEPGDAFKGFIDSNVILFVAMFIIGGAFFETGMANKIGGLVTKFAKTERQQIAAVMVVTGIMSGFLSNTGTAAVLIPVVIGIASRSGFHRSKLLLPLVFAAAMGGNLSLIGAPGNAFAQTALQEIGLEFGFFEYALIGLPVLIVGILFFTTIGYKMLPVREPGDDSTFQEKQDFSNVPAWKSWGSFVVLAITIICMIFEKQIGIKLHIIGCIGAIILVLTGIITEKQAYKSIDMRTIFLMGGMLALANALNSTGAGKAIADTVLGLLGANPSPFAILVALFLISCILTQFMSNTATTSMLVPIGISLAASLNADPRAIMMALVIGGSCAYATPIGMPANTMVYTAGGYKFIDYVKAGLPLVICSTIVSLILLPIFFPFFPA